MPGGPARIPSPWRCWSASTSGPCTPTRWPRRCASGPSRRASVSTTGPCTPSSSRWRSGAHQGHRHHPGGQAPGADRLRDHRRRARGDGRLAHRAHRRAGQGIPALHGRPVFHAALDPDDALRALRRRAECYVKLAGLRAAMKAATRGRAAAPVRAGSRVRGGAAGRRAAVRQGLIDEIETSTLEGLDMWRSFHDEGIDPAEVNFSFELPLTLKNDPGPRVAARGPGSHNHEPDPRGPTPEAAPTA